MTTSPCGKSWQVEAVCDGRLSGRALARAEGHISSCGDCRRERSALAQLSQQLRELDGAVDELGLRRLRELTLARAVAASRNLPEPTSLRRKVVTYALLAAAAVGVGAWALLPSRSAQSSSVQVLATPSAGAVWTMNRSGDVEYIDLADGLLSVAVRHEQSKGRLIVRLPDGQVEDVGTRFRVWVSRGHTSEISVTEGAVVFRRPGEAELVVRAGSSWRPPVPASEVASQSVVSLPAVSAAPRPPVAPAQAPARASARHSPSSDPSKEDAGYLHVVALMREHRDEEARLAGAAYLREFPNAFRHIEVERMLQAMSAR